MKKRVLVILVFIFFINIIGFVSAECSGLIGGQNAGTSKYFKDTTFGTMYINYIETYVNLTDYCINSSVMKDYNCNGGNVDSVEHFCVNGCNDGAGIKSICSDSDGGENLYVKGTLTITDANGVPRTSSPPDPYVLPPYTDSCTTDGKVSEYSCKDAIVEIGYCKYGCNLARSYSCPSGETCSNGICALCTASWSCSYWSTCTNNQQTRTCTNSNNCNTTSNKPSTSQSCCV